MPSSAGGEAGILRLFLGGDVMTGRGIDQVMATPCDPCLHEPLVRDARQYVQMAERANGPIPAPVPPEYVWGDALAEIDRRAPDFRLVNLETAITDAGSPWPGKGVHYRMHPSHAACLRAARIDCCSLANNHALDWGAGQLPATLKALRHAGILPVGAGLDLDSAAAPAVLPLATGGRLLVFAAASLGSGVPRGWAAAPGRAGLLLLDPMGIEAAERMARHVERWRRDTDRVIVTLHWGSNWGMAVPAEHRRFARRLIELGAADIVHGHSSHHPRPIEVVDGRLVLYGCGDLLNDYEGIEGLGGFDSGLVALYFASISLLDGTLRRLEILPMRLRRLQLARPTDADRQRLKALLESRQDEFPTALQAGRDGCWMLEPAVIGRDATTPAATRIRRR